MKRYEFVARPDEEGRRLDQFLAARFPGKASRTEIQRAVRERGVLVNGARVKKNDILIRPDDKLAFDWEAAPEIFPEKEFKELRVVYEDRYLFIVDKPAGLVVHPAPGHRTGTLVNVLLGSGKRLSDSGDRMRPGIVHRLDKDTSGLLVVAKTDAAHRKLVRMLQARSIAKHYTALVEGNVEFEEGKIDLPIGRHPRQRTLMAVRLDGKGRESVTTYRVLERYRHSTLLDVRILTGRTHQIRVHFAHGGHPVAGDAAYGARTSFGGRLVLHATRLEFEHPVTGKPVRCKSPLPGDLREILDKERKR